MKSITKFASSKVVVVGLLIAYLPSYIHPLMNMLGIQIGPEGPPSALLWNWLAVGILLVYILRIERRRITSILLIKPTKKDILWAFLFWVIAMGVSILIHTLLPPGENQGTDEILQYPLPFIIGFIMTAAITEEILFRGYPIERLKELTGRAWLAVTTSLVIFILPHITFFGWEWLLYYSTGTIAIYILYIWRKNLYACMFLHLLIDLPILLLALS